MSVVTDSLLEHQEAIHIVEGERRVYGLNPTQDVLLDDINVLSQTRPEGANPEEDEILASIKRIGLREPPEIAKFSNLDAVARHVEFVNEVFSASHTLDEVRKGSDGYWYIAIAGHTRVTCVNRIEKAEARKATRPSVPAYIHSNILIDPSPETVLAHQLDENLHSQPSPERKAMAIVQTYFYGLKHEQWKNKTEFLKQQGNRFSRRELNNAIDFANLPREQRLFIFDNAVPYMIGVQLGKTLPALREHYLYKYFGDKKYEDLTADEQTDLDDQVSKWAGDELAHIQNDRLSTKKVTDRYKGFRTNWEESRKESEREKRGEPGQVPMFEMDDGSEEWKRLRRRTLASYLAAIESLAQGPIDQAVRALVLHRKIYGPDAPELGKVQLGIEERLRRFAQGAGKTAAAVAIQEQIA